MRLRRAFFHWLIPAAFVLPLWLLVGWIATGSSAWALLWVLLSAPIVLVGQLVLSLLVRARGTVRAERAVSWSDVALIGAWHVLLVVLGLFPGGWWWPLLAVTVAVGVAALVTSFRQLWREARPSALLRTPGGLGYLAPERPRPTRAEPGVIVVPEQRTER